MTEHLAAESGGMLQRALDFLELTGARIVPAHHVRPDGSCSCGDVDCRSKGKHPRGGDGWQLRATSDPHEVRNIWTRWPDANIGFATGQVSGIVVLDVDGEEGERTLAGWCATKGPIPPTPTVRTSRGRHLYFAAGSVPLHCRQGAKGNGLGPGLDLRAEGGFCVAPGSVHESGRVYMWEAGLMYGSPEPAEVLSWIVERSRERPHVQAVPELPPRAVPASRAEKWASAALDRELGAVRAAAEGTRNNVLNAAAFNLGMLVEGGAIDGGLVRRLLHQAALEVGLGELEALKTIKSGMAAGAAKDQRSAPGRDLPGYERSNGHGRTAGASADSEPPGPDESSVQPLPSAMRPRFDTAALFAPLPAQRWAVPGIQIGPGRPTLIVGYGASAKTISMQALALACAAGRPIWNRFECSPLTVLHIDYEQTLYASAKRYQRLAIGMGLDWRELHNRLHYVEMPRVYLDKKGGEEEYLRACEGIDVVIIDALRGVAPHTDENDSAFRASIDALTYCSQRTGAAIIVIHHAGKPKKDAPNDMRAAARGSSAIFDASGCVLHFNAKPGDGVKLVQQTKAPAEAIGGALDPFQLAIEDVSPVEGELGGVRVVWQPYVAPDVEAEAEAAFERDASRLLRQVRRVPEGQTGTTIVARCGMRKARGLDVLRALVDDRRLVVVPGPTPRTKLFRLSPEGES